MARVESFLADQVATRPHASALTDSIGTDWTYADLNSASDALLSTLQQAGVQANDRVLLLSENCASAVAVLFACWKLDAVPIPVNARQSAGEVGARGAVSGARMVVKPVMFAVISTMIFFLPMMFLPGHMADAGSPR